MNIANTTIVMKLNFVALSVAFFPYFSLNMSVVRNKAPYDMFPSDIVNPNISDIFTV